MIAFRIMNMRVIIISKTDNKWVKWERVCNKAFVYYNRPETSWARHEQLEINSYKSIKLRSELVYVAKCLDDLCLEEKFLSNEEIAGLRRNLFR